MSKLNEELVKVSTTRLVPNCHSISHNPNTFKAVFWWNLDTKELSISTNSNVNHNNAEVYQDDNEGNWIKGRVFSFGSLDFMCLYWKHNKVVTKEKVHALLFTLETKLDTKIFYVVDYDGYEIEVN